MSFLIEQIKDQAILEMEVNLDEFIIENKISDSAIIHSMIFDKEVFAEEKEVREYLKDKYMYNPAIVDNGDVFTAVLIAKAQVDLDTEVKVELRRGVVAHAADLMPIQTMQEINFNEKGEFSLSCKLGTIDLHEGLPHIIEIARVAEGSHPSYGPIKITQDHLESMEVNFKSNAPGVDLAVNEDHRKNEAFGWFKDVFLSFDKQTLYGQVKWNTKGTQALSEKEYRYFSPEFRFNYVHPHTGVEHGPTLLGGALTNYPFLKMEAITELNNKNNSQGEKPVDKQTIELSIHNQTVVELSGKVSKAESDLKIVEAKNIELSDKVASLTKEVEQTKLEKVNEKLFKDGLINAAQLVALNEGKPSYEVLALSTKMNQAAAGSDEVKEDTIELSNKDKAFAKSLGLTDEEFAAGNK